MIRRLAVVCLLLALAGCAVHGPLADDLPTAAAAGSGLGEVRHRDEVRIALFVAMAFMLAAVVIVDLILLPFSHRRRHLHFPCCRAVIHLCIH